MKRFLVKISLFLAPLALVFGFAEFKVRQWPTGYDVVETLLREKGPLAPIVFVGDSQALYGFRPDEIAKGAINISNVSQSLAITNQILQRHLESLKCVSTVVIGLSSFALEYQLWGQADEERNYLHMQINGVQGDGPWQSQLDLRRWSRLFALGRDTSFDWLLKSLRQPAPAQPTGYTADGWYDGDQLTTVDRILSNETGLARANYHASTMRPSLYPINLSILTDLKQELEKRSIALVLLRLPTYETYWRNTTIDVANRNLAHDTDLKQRGFSIIDLSQAAGFQRDDFINNDHLNGRGALKLAERLRSLIIKPEGENEHCRSQRLSK